MKRLLNELNVSSKINGVTKNNFEDIIKEVYGDDKYKFYLNSELIDVNDRFRIFSFNDKDYIIKKTTKTDGDLEISLALSAFNALEGIKVNDYTIRIVKPQIFYDEELAYIVTEYMGTSLQEFAYDSTKKFPIGIDTLFDILDLFLSRGVLYRGFLPRNTIVKDKVIYLLDWEDVVFDINDNLTINLLWKTNFLLNWSYFFNYNELLKRISKFCSLDSEPSLLKYEKKFRTFTKLDLDGADLREFILEAVMKSEGKYNDKSMNFIIPSNDMVHLISDIFNSDIDVLFDITSVVLRRDTEEIYVSLMQKLSRSIIEAYEKNEDFQSIIIRNVLELMDTAGNGEFSAKLVSLYDDGSAEEFSSMLKKTINQILYKFNGSELGEEDYNRIFNYVWKIKLES